MDEPRTDDDAPTSGVSRRRFLTAMGAVGASVAAGALVWRAIDGEDDDQPNARKTADPTRNAASLSPETRTLHFAFPGMPDAGVGLWVAGQEHLLVPHTDETRSQLLAKHAPLLGDPAAVTHYAEDITFQPTVQQCPILGNLDADGHLKPGSIYLGAYTQIPKAAMVAAASSRASQQQAVAAFADDPAFRDAVSKALTGAATLGDVRAALSASPTVASTQWGTAAHWDRLGASAPANADEFSLLLDVVNPYDEAAFSMLLKHPEILNADPAGAAAIRLVLAGTPAVANLSTALQNHATTDAHGTYGQFVAQTAEDGTPLTYASLAPDGTTVTDRDQQPVPEVPLTHLSLDTELGADLNQAVSDALVLVKNAVELEGISYAVTTTSAPVLSKGQAAGTLGDSANATITGDALGGGTGGIRISLRNSDGSEATTVPIKDSIPLRFQNAYFRHTLVSVCFYDDAGNGVKAPGEYGAQAPFSYSWYPTAATQLFQWLPDSFRDNPYFRPLSMLTSAVSAFGVPVPSDVDKIDLTFPTGATSARVFVHGMGLGAYRAEELAMPVDDAGKPLYSTDSLDFTGSWLPNLLTVCLDLVLPAWMLLSDAYTAGTSKSIGGSVEDMIATDDVEGLTEYAETVQGLEKLLGAAGAAAFAFIVGTTTVKATAALDENDNVFEEFLQLGSVLLKIGGKSLIKRLWAKYVEAQTFAAAEKAIPFLGEALAVAGVVSGTIQVAMTAGDLIAAPKVLSAQVIPTYHASVTFSADKGGTNPDGTPRPGLGTLPVAATRYELQYHLNKHPSPRVIAGELPSGAAPPESFTVDVADVPVGGTIVWEVTLFTKEGWQVGHGSSDAVPNPLASPPTTASFSIIETPVPVTRDSSLDRKLTTTVEGGVGALRDTSADIPGTAASLSARGTPTTVSEIGDITIATRLSRLGYTWRSNGNWYARAMSAVGGKEGWWLAGPYPARPHLVFDGLTAVAEGAHQYLLEPKSGGYAVRRVTPGANGALQVAQGSVGWFPTYLDDVAYHPKGYLVGVRAGTGALHILAVATDPTADRQAPAPTFAAGLGSREGHLAGPSLVTVTPKGTIVTLDRQPQQPPQLRAFALDGNATRVLGSPDALTSIIDVPDDDGSGSRMYVGLASDGAGYLYLLSYTDNADPDSWQVQVLDDLGKPIYVTTGVNAGRLAVDYWRTGYTVDYRPILDGTPPYPADAKPFANAAGVAEPSVSLWLTETPR